MEPAMTIELVTSSCTTHGRHPQRLIKTGATPGFALRYRTRHRGQSLNVLSMLSRSRRRPVPTIVFYQMPGQAERILQRQSLRAYFQPLVPSHGDRSASSDTTIP